MSNGILIDDGIKTMLAVLRDSGKSVVEIDAATSMAPRRRTTLLQRLQRNRLAARRKEAGDAQPKWYLTHAGKRTDREVQG